MSAWPNMMGSSLSLITLELIDSLDSDPGKDRSCVTRSFSINSPVALTPSWSATPIGAISSPGMCRACSSSSNRFHPFLVSFIIDSAR